MKKQQYFKKFSYIGERKENQDAVFISKEHECFALLDGMGGTLGGGFLARLVGEATLGALEHIATEAKQQKRKSNNIMNSLKEHYEKMSTLALAIGKHPKYKGAGTTLEAGIIRKRKLYYGHIGDSATFIINLGKNGSQSYIEKLAIEHTAAEYYPEEQFKDKPGYRELALRNENITHYLGKENLKFPSTSFQVKKLKPGQIIFSATDGITKPLLDEELLEIFSNNYLQDVPEIIYTKSQQAQYLQELVAETDFDFDLQQVFGDNASFILYEVV